MCSHKIKNSVFPCLLTSFLPSSSGVAGSVHVGRAPREKRFPVLLTAREPQGFSSLTFSSFTSTLPCRAPVLVQGLRALSAQSQSCCVTFQGLQAGTGHGHCWYRAGLCSSISIMQGHLPIAGPESFNLLSNLLSRMVPTQRPGEETKTEQQKCGSVQGGDPQQCPCKASATSSSGLSPLVREVVLPSMEGHRVTWTGVRVCIAGTRHSPAYPVCV